MNSLATVWTDLQRKLAANPADWPVYVCPGGHEIALPPFSRLWDKETGRLTARPECLDCEKTRMAFQRSQRRLLADRESALLSHGVPARLAGQPFVGGMPHVLGHDLAAWTGGPATWAVVLHGVEDAGKSMLAAQLLWLRLPHIRTAAWWRAAHLLDALLGSFGEETRVRAHQESTADLLVIDDLGHVLGDRGLDVLYNLVTARQEQVRATILTLDESLVAFCKRHWSLGSKLTRDTLPVPFAQTYAERTRQEGSRAGKPAKAGQ